MGVPTVFDGFTIGLGMVSAEPEQRLENGHRIVAAFIPEGEFMGVNLESFIAHGSVASIQSRFEVADCDGHATGPDRYHRSSWLLAGTSGGSRKSTKPAVHMPRDHLCAQSLP